LHECNRLFEFENEQLVKLRDEVAREHHFRVAATGSSSAASARPAARPSAARGTG
jgi:hypothetical protein